MMAAEEPTLPIVGNKVPKLLQLIESFDKNGQASVQMSSLKQCVAAAKRISHAEVSDLSSTSNTERLSNAVQLVLQAAIVPSFDSRDYFSYSEEDFEWCAEIAELVFSLIYELLKLFRPVSRSSHVAHPQEQVVYEATHLWLYPNQLKLLILIAAHMKGNLWSSLKTQQMCHVLLPQLLIVHKASSVQEFLCVECPCPRSTSITETDKFCFFSQIMNFCKTPLGKDQWQKNPFLAEAFSWILSNVKLPHLSEYIDQIMAISLNFVDDHQVINKVRGIELLHHLLLNTSAEEMRWFNRAEVIYESFKHQLYSKDACVLEKLLSCLLSLLQIIEPTKSNDKLERHHEVYETLLRETENENLIAIRRVYMTQMKAFTSQIGIGCVRHLRSTVRIVEQYLDVEDGPQDQARCDALALLHTVILVAWPRIHQHAQRIVQFLCKFLVNISSSVPPRSKISPDIKRHMIQQVIIILRLLMQVAPELQACFLNLQESSSCSLQGLKQILSEVG
ncbi:TELO2-interacting protein 2-like [Elysia marginata]|uniref:TELO2-interacting protein 2-like n=1 Tax=Elysia marginata TaxID=1093978 RepID=A0AAV4F3W8_9GAST|nr:TELO2-interacting protein 2-like [Elysia marginata]